MNNLAKYYQVLELEPGASLEEIDRAYKDLVFVWHPDRLPSDNQRLQDKAQAKLKAINEAREKLRSHRPHQSRAKTATARSPHSNGKYNGYNRSSHSPPNRSQYGYYTNGYYDPSKVNRTHQPKTATSPYSSSSTNQTKSSNGSSPPKHAEPVADNTPRQYYRYYSPPKNGSSRTSSADRQPPQTALLKPPLPIASPPKTAIAFAPIT